MLAETHLRKERCRLRAPPKNEDFTYQALQRQRLLRRSSPDHTKDPRFPSLPCCPWRSDSRRRCTGTSASLWRSETAGRSQATCSRRPRAEGATPPKPRPLTPAWSYFPPCCRIRWQAFPNSWRTGFWRSFKRLTILVNSPRSSPTFRAWRTIPNNSLPRVAKTPRDLGHAHFLERLKVSLVHLPEVGIVLPPFQVLYLHDPSGEPLRQLAVNTVGSLATGCTTTVGCFCARVCHVLRVLDECCLSRLHTNAAVCHPLLRLVAAVLLAISVETSKRLPHHGTIGQAPQLCFLLRT